MCFMGNGLNDTSIHFPGLTPQGLTPGSYVYTHLQTHHLITDLLAEEREAACEGKDGRYRISNGPGMKRFLIFRLAAFQWNGALALISAPGSIIGVSLRSVWPPQSTPIMELHSMWRNIRKHTDFNKSNKDLKYRKTTYKRKSLRRHCIEWWHQRGNDEERNY